MFKKAFLYTALSLTYAIGMVLKIVANWFLAIAEKIILMLEKKKTR